MSAKTVENKVNSIWKNICLQNEFHPFVRKSFITANTDLARFYHLIKTHKTGPVTNIRPIVSNTNGPTQRISWLLASALKPMLKDVPAHLENSLELIKCTQAGDFTTNKTLPYPCSLDVVSLYISISIQVQEAITNATDRIRTPILHLAKQDIMDLLTVTLNNMYFSFNGQVFRQKEGLPMGSNISGIMAVLFMDRLETIALSSHLSKRPHRRYVDDIYLQTTGEDMDYTMNNLHPNLKSEIENPEITPNGLSLSLLDFKVTISIDGQSSFEFNKKKNTAKKKQFSSTTNQRYRKSQRSTSFVMSEIASKINALQKRQPQNIKTCLTTSSVFYGYPEGTIDQTKHSQNHHKDPRPLDKEWSYRMHLRTSKLRNH